MKIGITGWRGFVGSHIKYKIKNPILFQGDLRDLADVNEFTRKCDRIYHIAGRNKISHGKLLANNIVSTGNIVLSLKQQGINPEIVFVSTSHVVKKPNSEYGFTKTIEEDIIKKAEKWCIFRISNVYGPGGKPFYNSVVATFTYQLANRMDVNIHEPENVCEFIYIDDLVDQLLAPEFMQCITIRGESMSIREVFEFLTTKLGEHENLKKCLDYYGGKN